VFLIGLDAEGYGFLAAIFLLPPSDSMLTVPATLGDYKSDKWEYSIVTE
jgi:hypothetical protein